MFDKALNIHLSFWYYPTIALRFLQKRSLFFALVGDLHLFQFTTSGILILIFQKLIFRVELLSVTKIYHLPRTPVPPSPFPLQAPI